MTRISDKPTAGSRAVVYVNPASPLAAVRFIGFNSVGNAMDTALENMQNAQENLGNAGLESFGPELQAVATVFSGLRERMKAQCMAMQTQ